MTDRANEHLLLNDRAGWRAAHLDSTIRVDGEGHLSLRHQPGAARPLVDGRGSFGGLALPTGLAVDSKDQVYILDAQAHLVKKFDPCAEEFATLACIGGQGSEPRKLRDPEGIAISSRDDLYIADTGNRRVQVFALKGLALRAIRGPLAVIKGAAKIFVKPVAAAKPAVSDTGKCIAEQVFPDNTWQPWDIAISCDNRAYISDYANGVIHLFDSLGRWSKAFTGESADSPPLERPTHIALDKTGKLYIVQEGKDYVTVLDADGKFLARVERPGQVKGRFCPVAIAVDEEGNLFIGQRYARRLYLYCQTEEGVSRFTGECRAFDGTAAAVAFDKSGNALISDLVSRRVLSLKAQGAFETEGTYFSEPLDSRLYRCEWHRVAMRVQVRPGAQVRVDTFTSESEKTAAEIESLPESRWSTAQIDAEVGQQNWDCLIRSTPGRYLWLRLTLTGDGSSTPVVEQVRIFYPRASSLQYLPAVYSEMADSREFMGRFLSIFDTMWGRISDQITDIARYFDPAATPAGAGEDGGADFLSWLASWLDLTLDRHWPEHKRRRLLAEAHRLYALRGTAEGLRLHIELYAGVEARILEHFKLRRWLFLNHARLGDQSALFGKAIVNRLQLDEHSRIGSFQLIDSGDPVGDPFHQYAHQFTVFVPAGQAASELERQTLERIVEMAKPAHTAGVLEMVGPRFRIGIQSFIGVDTIIGRYPDQVIEGRAKVGFDSVLGPSADEASAPTMRVGVRARIGSSTFID